MSLCHQGLMRLAWEALVALLMREPSGKEWITPGLSFCAAGSIYGHHCVLFI